MIYFSVTVFYTVYYNIILESIARAVAVSSLMKLAMTLHVKDVCTPFTAKQHHEMVMLDH